MEVKQFACKIGIPVTYSQGFLNCKSYRKLRNNDIALTLKLQQ